jgi:hypothetical protein
VSQNDAVEPPADTVTGPADRPANPAMDGVNQHSDGPASTGGELPRTRSIPAAIVLA